MGFSIGAGLVGGLALLTKYYSLLLFATFFLVALLHPDRRRYFASAAPYISLAVGLLAVAPHAWWSFASGFTTIDYAISKTHYDVAEARSSASKAVVGSIASLGIAAVAFAIAFGSQAWVLVKRAVAGSFEARNAWLVCMTHGPLLLTVAAYLFASVRITTGFLLPAFFSTPVIFLAVARANVPGIVLRRFAYCVAGAWLCMLGASPLLGYRAFALSAELAIDPTPEIALEATRLWRGRFGGPLRYVSGEGQIATAIAFYSPDAPSYMILDHPTYSPWAPILEAKREGLLVVCPRAADDCIRRGTAFAGGETVRVERELGLHFFGLAGKSRPFVFIMHLPEP